jgi:hypothetical protein
MLVDRPNVAETSQRPTACDDDSISHFEALTVVFGIPAFE